MCCSCLISTRGFLSYLLLGGVIDAFMDGLALIYFISFLWEFFVKATFYAPDISVCWSEVEGIYLHYKYVEYAAIL